MKLRVDIGDVHALIALVCGGTAALFSLTCLVDEWSDNTLIISLVGCILAAFWTSLFGLVLRGTLLTRITAGLGLVAAIFSVCTGMLAAAIH